MTAREPQDTENSMTRREFLSSASGAITIATLGVSETSPLSAAPATPTIDPLPQEAIYPPSLNGIRGQTADAMAAAHGIRDAAQGASALITGSDLGEEYDLVVVGAGMSGLSAAYFYRKQLPASKILILEGCDDIGGHARRNEFLVDGRPLVGIGGTYALALPNSYTPEGKALLADIGINTERYLAATKDDLGLFQGIQSKTAVFFGRETYGKDLLVDNYPDIMPFLLSDEVDPARLDLWNKFLPRTPLSKIAQKELHRIMVGRPGGLQGMSTSDLERLLRSVSYLEYLRRYFGIGDESSLFVQKLISGFHLNVGAGPDSFSARLAREAGCPGFDGLELPARRISGILPNNGLGEDIRLPDGNAGVARLLARWLIPDSLPGHTMEDSVSTPLRYSVLDKPGNDVRIRLGSTVCRVTHKGGDPLKSTEVEVCYLREREYVKVRAKTCVMACFNAIVPYLCPELPQSQKHDLKLAVRKPLVWVAVALRNWKAFAKLQVGLVFCPGSFYELCWLDLGITLGQVRPSSSPEMPAIVYLGMAPNSPGIPAREQYRLGRALLQGIDRDTYEREAKNQLQRVLGGGGFEAARDVAGITINRWAHGYACGGNDLYDPPVTGAEPPAWVRGRQRFGRIAIANSDAAGISLTQTAFDQANRAVRELVADVIRPQFYNLNPEQG